MKHIPPDTGFYFRAEAVWGWVRYLPITEAPNNTEYLRMSMEKTLCSFQIGICDLWCVWDNCFTSLSARSWQCLDRRKPKVGPTPYSYLSPGVTYCSVCHHTILSQWKKNENLVMKLSVGSSNSPSGINFPLESPPGSGRYPDVTRSAPEWWMVSWCH